LVFLACHTQWRKEVPGMASEWVWHGLRYDGCECVIRNMGFKGQKAREIFLDLQLMERAALPILNRPKK
jgi:hypothetical protein